MLWAVACLFPISVRADTSVVFNEIMYHPATNQPAMEWVELYNQMAVDVDMSGWSLDGAIHYPFPTNTIVHGGGFLVIAFSPTTLAAATGLTNILGPLTNQLSNSDTLKLRNNNGRVVSEISYGADGDWPVAPDGSGVSLAKLDHSTASGLAQNWAMSAEIGGTPGRENFPTNFARVPLAFNEISSGTNAQFWLELANYGTNSIPLTGYIIAWSGVTNAEYVWPAGPILPAGGFITISNATLGFHPTNGDKLFLLPPNRTNVLDAVVVKSVARCRSPDGTGPWFKPTIPTPGSSNFVVLHNDIVINEIMYHHQLLPPTNNAPGPSSNEQWVELFNRGSNAVDLTGWELDGGLSYHFPAGKILNPGAYLVVAKDSTAFRAAHPSLDILGDFSGKLSHNGDTIVLDDAEDNPACSLTYFPGGRWPEAADGGGSSLELRNPQADISNAGAWAASDESAKSSWQTFSYQAVAQTVVGDPTEPWNDFILGLLSGGECYVDDISVLESPTNTPVEFISNGNFETGATGWRFVGNHRLSRVEPEPGNPANHVLHIITDSVQGDSGDHIETTIKSGKKVTNGRLYQVSFRARWLTGNNLLNTRLYYNRVTRTTALSVPTLNGTPGAPNSQYSTNIGPTFTLFQHQPVIPPVTQPVTVSVLPSDPQGVSSCEVWWSVNGAAFSHASMSNQSGGLYTGTIPGAAAGALVQFYVRAVDGLGAASTFPAAGSNSAALYTVADGQADFTKGHNLRVLLSPANWALFRAPTNLMSDGFLPCTIIYDEQRPYYDVSVRLKGSMLGRVNDPHPSFHLEFRPDDLFRGVHSSMLIDTSGRPGANNPQLEILVHHMMLHAGGIPEIQPDLCRVITPFLTNTCSGVLEPRFEDEFISTAYPNGGNGTEFLVELDYFPTTSNTAGYKLPSPSSLWGSGVLDIKDYGDDKEIYRYQFQIKNHRNDDNYSRFIPFCQTLYLPNTPILDAQSKLVMDVDEWLRVYALISLLGENDYYSFGNPHNLLMYVRPDNNRVTAFPWDVEQIFLKASNAPLIGIPCDWTDLESVFPGNKRRLYAHALDIMASTFNTSYMSYWVTHYGNLCGQDFSDLLGWIPSRTTAVRAEINSAGGNAPFALTSAASLTTSNNLVTLSGTAPIAVQSLMINGIAYAVTWTTVSNWSIAVPLSIATNVLHITAYDLHGNPLTNAATVTVNYTGAPPNPAGRIAINEIMYNPLLPGAAYVELYNSSTTTSFDLSNWQLNGLGYTFPSGCILATNKFLVLAQDQSAFINAYGPAIVPYDIYPGTLQADGETLSLVIPAAQTNLSDVIVDKVRYATNAPWPATGPGISVQLIDPAQDHFRVANWAAAVGTPAATNSVRSTLPAFPPLWLNEIQAENLTGITNHVGARTPWLEIFNPTTNSVVLTNLYVSGSYTNLTAWAFPTGAVLNPGQFKVIFADGQTNLSTTNELHTSFSLPPGAGSLALSRVYQGQPKVLDFVNYTNVSPNRSYGSFPDAQVFTRQEFFTVTPGATNSNASSPLSVTINEWMAGNTHTITNPVSGKFSDWFELYNYGTNSANLSGFYLTDNLTNQFQFQVPFGYSVPPHGFLLVWADGRNTNGTADLHANFKLSKSGGSIGIYGSDGVPIDFINYTTQTDDISEGRFPDGANARFFMNVATPRTTNIIPNTPPVLGPLTNRALHYGQAIAFTATATDAESAFQTLAFSLDPGAPSGASIQPATGAFVWTAIGIPVPSTNSISVRVTDNGTPPLSAFGTFNIFVYPPPSLTAVGSGGSNISLSFGTVPGNSYQVQYKDNLEDLSWTALGVPIPGNGGMATFQDDFTTHPQRFYRLLVMP